jgi:hypothetical protein
VLRIHIGFNAYPDPVEKISFLSETAINRTYSKASHKEHPSYRRSFQPSKENTHHCFILLTLLDPDPTKQINADPLCSGSTALYNIEQ